MSNNKNSLILLLNETHFNKTICDIKFFRNDIKDFFYRIIMPYIYIKTCSHMCVDTKELS